MKIRFYCSSLTQPENSHSSHKTFVVGLTSHDCRNLHIIEKLSFEITPQETPKNNSGGKFLMQSTVDDSAHFSRSAKLILRNLLDFETSSFFRYFKKTFRFWYSYETLRNLSSFGITSVVIDLALRNKLPGSCEVSETTKILRNNYLITAMNFIVLSISKLI